MSDFAHSPLKSQKCQASPSRSATVADSALPPALTIRGPLEAPNVMTLTSMDKGRILVRLSTTV